MRFLFCASRRCWSRSVSACEMAEIVCVGDNDEFQIDESLQALGWNSSRE